MGLFDLSSLECIVLAAAPCPPEVKRAVFLDELLRQATGKLAKRLRPASALTP